MREAVRRWAFREDLFYRLDVFHIEVSPLRQRSSDVPRLLEEFLRRYNQQLQKNIRGVAPDLMNLLTAYEWPGNVRELRNIVERLIIMCIDDVLLPEHLFTKYFSLEMTSEAADVVSVRGIPQLADAVSSVEKIVVTKALEATKSTRKAAKLIGVSQSTIMRKIRDYDLHIE